MRDTRIEVPQIIF